jgi:hypothetical protein
MDILNAEGLQTVITIPGELIIGDWHRLEREVERVFHVARTDLMKNIVKDRDHYGLGVPNHWRTDYGSTTSRGSEEAGTGEDSGT